MLGHLLFGGAVAGAAVATAVFATGPAIPTDRWLLDESGEQCVAARKITSQNLAFTISIKPKPLAEAVDLNIGIPDDLKPANLAGTAKLGVPTKPQPIDVPFSIFGEKSDASRAITLKIDRPDLAAIAAATSFSISIDGIEKITIDQSSMADAIAALNWCEKQLLSKVDFVADPEERLAVTPAAADPTARGDWIKSSDYPSGTKPGKVTIGWIIGNDGLVHGCHQLTQGSDPRIANAACVGLGKRARFIPAKDATGKSVRSFFKRQIVYAVH